jgi:hypothetical protein
LQAGVCVVLPAELPATAFDLISRPARNGKALALASDSERMPHGNKEMK